MYPSPRGGDHHCGGGDDDSSSSSQSIDLLADTPPKIKKKKNHHRTEFTNNALSTADDDDDDGSKNVITSPATLTLNHLSQSQQMTDLHYDMNNLEEDVAAQQQGLAAQNGNHQAGRTATTTATSNNDDEDSDASLLDSRSNNNKTTSLGQSSWRKVDHAVEPKSSSLSSQRPGAAPSARTKSTKQESSSSSFPKASTKNQKAPPPKSAPAARVGITTTTTKATTASSTRAKGVEQYDLITGVTLATFKSMRSAGRECGLDHRHIMDAVNGRHDDVSQKGVGGFGWRLVANGSTNNIRGGGTTTAAAKKNAAALSTIGASQAQRNQGTAPFLTKRARNGDVAAVPMTEEGIRAHKRPKRSCYSATKCSGDNNNGRKEVDDSSSSQKSTNGQSAKSTAEPPPSSQVSVATNTSRRSHRGLPVQQIVLSTQRVVKTYSSQREAERETKIDRKEIGRVLSGTLTEAGGYGWRFEGRPSSKIGNENNKKATAAASSQTSKPTPRAIKQSGAVPYKNSTQKDLTVPKLASATKKRPTRTSSQKARAAWKKDTSATATESKTEMAAKESTRKSTSLAAKPAAKPRKKDKTKETTLKERADSKDTSFEKPASQLDELSVGDFRILRFEIISAGRLGMDISLRDAVPDLKQDLDRQGGSFREAADKCCLITGVDPNGLAQMIGLRPGDCFVQECKHCPGRITFSEYDDVKYEAKSGMRPLVLFVARRKVGFEDFVSKAIEELSTTKSASPLFDPVTKELDLYKPKADTTDKPERKSMTDNQATADITDNVPPFCRKCNNPSGKIPVHHAWCSKHEHFLISGAQEIVEEIHEGMAINCKTCLEEYQIGRAIQNGVHAIGCSRRPPAAKKPPTQKEEKDKKQSGRISTLNKQVSTKGRAIRPTSKVQTGYDIASIDSGDDSEISDFETDMKSKRKSMTVKRDSEQKKGNNKKRKANAPKTSENKRKRKAPAGKATTSKTKGTQEAASNVGKKNHVTENASQNRGVNAREGFGASLHGMGPLSSDWEVSSDSDCDDELETNWESCGNPWGFSGYRDGDVVVYAPNLPPEETEAAVLSERFENDPFSEYARYRTTHTTPDEGLHTLVLRRDILCNSPWGFLVYRDDLGGACLVKDIVPMSPADTATLAGFSSENVSPRGLTPNDMILAINGKLIGGMTTIALGIELELAGPSMLLTVSRYKFPNQMSQRIVAQERKLHSQLDDLSKDKRHLGWIDFVCEQNQAGRPSHARESVEIPKRSVAFDGSHSDPHSIAQNMQDSPRSVPMKEIVTTTPSSPVNSLGTNGSLEKYENSTAGKSEQEDNKSSDSSTTETKAPVHKPPQISPKTPRFSNRTNRVGFQNSAKKSSPGPSQGYQTNASDASKGGSVSKRSCPIEEEWSDDGNAWLGCVCGKIHERSPHFWVQCDECMSWYNVIEQCVGISKEDAAAADKWLCPGCAPVPDGQSQSETDLPGGVEKKATFCQAKTGHKKDFSTRLDYKEVEKQNDPNTMLDSKQGPCNSDLGDHSAHLDKTTKNAEGDETVSSDKSEDISKSSVKRSGEAVEFKFEKGQLVFVKEHAWSGVNNSEGVARVLGAYRDEDGDPVYDVKYVVGGRAKGVFQEYLSNDTQLFL